MQLLRSSGFGPLSPCVDCRRSTATSHAYQHVTCKGHVSMAETGLVWHLSSINIKTMHAPAVRVHTQCLKGLSSTHVPPVEDACQNMLHCLTSGWLPSSPQQTQQFANLSIDTSQTPPCMRPPWSLPSVAGPQQALHA